MIAKKQNPKVVKATTPPINNFPGWTETFGIHVKCDCGLWIHFKDRAFWHKMRTARHNQAVREVTVIKCLECVKKLFQ